jgi:response regulator RpfG family c-di-GMP phosphodiesterase
MNKKLDILCVDDEPQVLEGLRLHLKQRYTVHLAGSGAEGLEILRDAKNIAVILSDMRMPVMDGAKFLNAARTSAPEAVRMLLTGYTDMQSAIAAVNEGQIFRFISKPCPPDQLLAAFGAAVTQHQLIVAEKVLLQQTLLGCVESMVKVLSITKPMAFGRALRLRAKIRSVVQFLLWGDQWQIEAAAVLSQLGIVTLPEETLMKLHEGESLDDSDRREIAASIDTSIQMLENIPRLEPVLEILAHLAGGIRGVPPLGRTIPPGALLLRIVLEWDALEAQGYTQAQALAKLRNADGAYDTELLDRLGGMLPVSGTQTSAIETAPRDLVAGMVLAEDLVRKNGVVILPRGFEIDRGLLDHIHTFADELKDGPVRVFAHA